MYAHPANIYVPVKRKEWFITNPVHKTADMIPSNVGSYLSGKGSQRPDEEMLEVLHTRGYITETPVSLPDIYNTMPPEPTSFVGFSIAVTYDCNLQCSYCFQGTDPGMNTRNTATLTPEKIELLSDAIDILKRKYLILSSTDKIIEFTGGEPLLPSNYSLVESLLSILKNDNILITTNGTYVSDFIDLLSSYLVRLKITVDGTPSVHNKRRKTSANKGTYHQIIDGIQKARDAGIPVIVKVNIDPGNIDNLRLLLDKFKLYKWTEDTEITLGLSRVRATPQYPSMFTEAEYVEHICSYLEKYSLQEYFEVSFTGSKYFKNIISGEEPKTSMHRCRNDRAFFFSPDGLIYPCILMTSYPVGTFFPQFFLDEAKLDALTSRTIRTLPQCMKCPYALLCGGGCPAESMNMYDSIFHSLCTDYPRILKVYIPYLLRTRSREENTM